MVSRWKTMRPHTSRQLAMLFTAASVAFLWRTFDAQSWKPIGEILRYWWVLFLAWIGYVVIDAMLMEWFGKRDEEGKVEQFIDPTELRLEGIEAAINRLHDYVKSIDPELAEENRLERKFMSGEGNMFAGIDHMEHVRDREKRGLRTRHTSIWRDHDVPGNSGANDAP